MAGPIPAFPGVHKQVAIRDAAAWNDALGVLRCVVADELCALYVAMSEYRAGGTERKESVKWVGLSI